MNKAKENKILKTYQIIIYIIGFNGCTYDINHIIHTYKQNNKYIYLINNKVLHFL